MRPGRISEFARDCVFRDDERWGRRPTPLTPANGPPVDLPPRAGLPRTDPPRKTLSHRGGCRIGQTPCAPRRESLVPPSKWDPRALEQRRTRVPRSSARTTRPRRPWGTGDDGARSAAREPTHVVELRGDELAFVEALETAVQSGGEDVLPLLAPVDATPLGQLADIRWAISARDVAPALVAGTVEPIRSPPGPGTLRPAATSTNRGG
jgi:hypothetical protein